MHIFISKLTIIASDNGLSPGWCQAIFWINAVILLIGPLGTNFSEILVEIHTNIFVKENEFENIVWKWRPLCLGLSVLKKFYCSWDGSYQACAWKREIINHEIVNHEIVCI